MSNISETLDVTNNFKDLSLKKTTVLTGNHMKNPRARTMSENVDLV